jgi:hypothetical protein
VGRFFEFRVTPDRAQRTLMRQLRVYEKKRLPAIEGYVAQQAAEYVRRDILNRVHGTELEGVYRRGLTVARVGGVNPQKGIAYTLRVNPKADRITPVEAKRAIIFVISRSSVLVPPLPEVMILQNHGPWTTDTLPFVPPPRNAKLFYRSVSAKEATAVTSKQKDPIQRRKIQSLLDRIGFRPPRADLKVKTSPVITAVPDVAYQGLRTEFGLGGTEKLPHWRPALRDLRVAGVKRILKGRDLKDAIGKPRYNQWTHWPPRTPDTVSVQDSQAYKSFEKRLRIR